MILSVIVPVYNVEKYLARCLESILDQDLDSNLYEVIIVNDGSPDRCLEIANSFQKKYNNILVVTQENGGVSSARNTGIKQAVGKYIYFIDPDDYIEKNVFKWLLEIQELYALDFLGFKTTHTILSDYNVKIDFDRNVIPQVQEKMVCNGVDFISNNNFLNGPWWYIFRKDLLDNNELLFEKGRMLEDGIFTVELLLNCNRALSLDVDIYRYFKHSNSIVNSKKKEHLTKLNDDFRFVIHKFEELLEIAKEKRGGFGTIKRLQCRQESFLFFLFVRLLKNGSSWKLTREIITEMKCLGIYPMMNFIGIDYYSKNEKILTFIFNNPILFFLALKINKIVKIIK